MTKQEIFNTPLSQLDKNYRVIKNQTVIFKFNRTWKPMTETKK